MRRGLVGLLLAAAVTAPGTAAFGEMREGVRPLSLWKRSLAVLAASTVLDAHSSIGRRELNPLLRDATGRFGTRGIAIKTAMTGAALGAQWLLLRRSERGMKAAAAINFGLSGTLAAVAVHNYGNGKAKKTPAGTPGTE